MASVSTSQSGFDDREYQRGVMARNRAGSRDISIAAVANPDRRAKCEADDCLWLRTYLPHIFYNEFTADQQAIIAECGETLRYGTAKCVAAPRGDGKSSITKYLTLKYALYRQIRFAVIIAATSKKGTSSLSDIKKVLRNTELAELREDFPLETSIASYVGPAPSRANNATISTADVEQLPVLVEWQPTHLILPNLDGSMGPIIAALGITSDDIQGCNIHDIRPDFVMLDDLDSRDSLAAADGVVAAKIEEAVDKTVAGLGGPNRRLGRMMLCTITSREAAAYRYSDPEIKPAYSGRRVSRIKSWPTNTGLWDEYCHLRHTGKATKGDDGRPIDPHGRKAHEYYAENRDAMDAGAELSNPYDFNQLELPDGSPTHLSALQKCYDYIADNGMESFLTEHQNDPPEDERSSRLVLTAYHIQHNCLSGLERRICPDDTVLLTCGADVQKRGLHWAMVAWSAESIGCVVDYDFFEFGTDGRKAAECELSILEGLHNWHTAVIENPYHKGDGEVVDLDLALIDMGWKDESWASQPVQDFCYTVGGGFLPSKGIANYRPPKPGKTREVGDQWHIDYPLPFVAMNTDHWKLKVHEGFLGERGTGGSIALFNQPSVDGRMQRNFHLSFAKHITAETWETRTVPGFKRPETRWWHFGKPNHWFDATYQAICARSVRGLHPAAVAAVPSEAKSQAEKPRQEARRPSSRRRISFRR